jgi:hypothetical protein
MSNRIIAPPREIRQREKETNIFQTVRPSSSPPSRTKFPFAHVEATPARWIMRLTAGRTLKKRPRSACAWGAFRPADILFCAYTAVPDFVVSPATQFPLYVFASEFRLRMLTDCFVFCVFVLCSDCAPRGALSSHHYVSDENQRHVTASAHPHPSAIHQRADPVPCRLSNRDAKQ